MVSTHHRGPTSCPQRELLPGCPHQPALLRWAPPALSPHPGSLPWPGPQEFNPARPEDKMDQGILFPDMSDGQTPSTPGLFLKVEGVLIHWKTGLNPDFPPNNKWSPCFPALNGPGPALLTFQITVPTRSKLFSDLYSHLCRLLLSKAFWHLGYTSQGLNNIGDL